MMIKCKRCNRILKNPKSIAMEMGMCCALKEGLIKPKIKKKKEAKLSCNVFDFENK